MCYLQDEDLGKYGQITPMKQVKGDNGHKILNAIYEVKHSHT